MDGFITIDVMTEGDIAELLDLTLEDTEGQTISEAQVMRTQVEFWQAGRNSIIPVAWQERARKIVERRRSREATKREGRNEKASKGEVV